jgi:hypothetical protein
MYNEELHGNRLLSSLTVSPCRHFIWQVESAFRDAGISVHVLHLSRKKLHIQAVIRQMIVEGVHAVIFMERHHELTGRVNMQIFDQSVRPRDGNVKFDGMWSFDVRLFSSKNSVTFFSRCMFLTTTSLQNTKA